MFARQHKRTTMNALAPQQGAGAREVPEADLKLVTGGLRLVTEKPLCSWTSPRDPDGIFICDDD